jgi:nicotinamidase-related amidase
LDRERDERFAVIDRMREAFKDVSPEEIEREADRSVAAAREHRRPVVYVNRTADKDRSGCARTGE